MVKPIALVAVLASGIATAAAAAPISYTHTGFGSGSIDGDPFGLAAPVAFTITATGDTDDIESCATGCFFIDNLTASIDIAGVGSFDFTTATRYVSNTNVDSIGFSRETGALFIGPTVVDWDMTTSVGPVSGSGQLFQWLSSPVNTDGGVLVFNSADGVESTFEARVGFVPEPASLLLLASGIAVAVRRRARRA